jgi:hypothetical protein
MVMLDAALCQNGKYVTSSGFAIVGKMSSVISDFIVYNKIIFHQFCLILIALYIAHNPSSKRIEGF